MILLPRGSPPRGIIRSFKGDATDMVRFLGPALSVNVILDKLDSLYSSMPTFDVMMQGFYKGSQEKSESIACYVARLEGKLNEIWVKHPSMVSEAETVGYIRVYLFYGLRKPFREVIHAIFYNPINNYMVFMQAVRKAEGKHKQQKHNNSCASNSGVVSDVPLDNEDPILTQGSYLSALGKVG